MSVKKSLANERCIGNPGGTASPSETPAVSSLESAGERHFDSTLVLDAAERRQRLIRYLGHAIARDVARDHRDSSEVHDDAQDQS
jgi:hypothetical protein